MAEFNASLRLVHVSKSFGDPPTHVLHDVDLTIHSGEMVSLLGRSGSGKSTLLYIMSTLDKPSSGSVAIGGTDVASMGSRVLHDFRNRYVGFVFQFHYLLPELTALENVLMPAMKSGEARSRRDRAAELLGGFDLGTKLDRLPSQLSGGEQQRVAIARALVMEPRFLFADEPTGNLDSVNGDLVMRLLQEVNRAQRTTIVYVTHDPDYANLAGRKIQLQDGRVVS